jgi:imidazolonepropionase-like amidohydrolase
MKKLWLLYVLFVFPLYASDSIVIRGGTILTVTNGVVKNGIIVIENGKFMAVGIDVNIPEGAVMIDAAGMVVTPGLIDSHSHLGLGPSGGITEDNETSSPAMPQLRIIDSIHPEGVAPHRFSFRDAVKEGVTTVIARPGSGNVIGGQSAALKLTGKTVDDMILKFPCDMKMAMGRKGYGEKGQLPVTKMGVAYVVRKAMVDAINYRKSLEDNQKKGKKSVPPKRDLKNEAMLMVLERKIPVHVHASMVDNIMTAVRLGDEFNFYKLSIAHGDEAYKIADVLAEKKIVVVVGPRMIVSDRDGHAINLSKRLVEAGVEICIMTDADVVQQEFLRFQAALAVKYGLDSHEALKAITINPAKLIGMENRIGSIETGKDADLVIFEGDPFDIATGVKRVLINGKTVFQSEEKENLQ